MDTKPQSRRFYTGKVFLVFVLMAICRHIFAQATFLIWPIYPNIESNEKATAVWLENTGKSEALIQVRVFKWDQQQYKDNYEIQSEIIPSPPVVKIKAGTKNMLRLTRIMPAPLNTEQAYRVIVDELPIQLENTSSQNIAVNFQIRYSIPLFSYGQGMGSGLTDASIIANAKNPLAQPNLSYWTEKNKDGEATLYIKNTGSKFARISEIRMHEKSDPLNFNYVPLGYILANSTMTFHLSSQLAERIQNSSQLYAVDSSGAALKVILLKRVGQ